MWRTPIPDLSLLDRKVRQGLFISVIAISILGKEAGRKFCLRRIGTKQNWPSDGSDGQGERFQILVGRNFLPIDRDVAARRARLPQRFIVVEIEVTIHLNGFRHT